MILLRNWTTATSLTSPPMRVLFMIPQHDPPKLEGDFSKETVTFVQEEKVAGIVAAVGIPLTVCLLIILQILGKKIECADEGANVLLLQSRRGGRDACLLVILQTVFLLIILQVLGKKIHMNVLMKVLMCCCCCRGAALSH